LDMRIDIKDELGAKLVQNPETKRSLNSNISIKGITKSKARALKDFGKYQQHASSTDHLKRVQDIPRFVTTEESLTLSPTCSLEDDTEKIIVSDPISTLIRIDNKFWLCLSEVNVL